MKALAIGLCAIIFGLGLGVSEAEAARRFGGGGSFGMQRQATPPAKAPTAAPAPTSAAGAAAAAQPKRSWLGPLAGLAAGIGLASLLSHFGLGEGVAQFLMFALLALAVVMAVRFFLNRRNGTNPAPMQYARAAANPSAAAGANTAKLESLAGGGSAAPAAASAAPAMLAGFDAEAFVRQAKLMFVRLQAANDTGNLDDLREFTSPEVCAEAQMQIKERGGAMQRTEIVTLEAAVIESAQEFGRYVVSVHFHGTLREDDGAAEAFDEIWHVTKPLDGSRGWAVAGIQQSN